MWVKICGLQQIEQARTLAGFKIQAIGINRYPPSSRFVDQARASELAESIYEVDPHVKRVGVYVNAKIEDILDDIDEIDFNVIQLHGDESPEYVNELSQYIDVIKVFRVDDAFTVERFSKYSPFAFLVDAYDDDQYGGTGKTTAWDRVKKWTEKHRIILAGGLNSNNIRDAINTVNPWGVDVCSGIEDENGNTDLDKIRSLLDRIPNTVTEGG